MDTAERRSPLRILAPVALVLFGLALVLIISSSSGGSSGGGTSSSAVEKARDLGSGTSAKSKSRKSSKSDKLPKSVYVVQSGDTLGSISQKVGVSVTKLQELNPNLDQFSLVAGQKIKIR
jgi:LysM repeat protein